MRVAFDAHTIGQRATGNETYADGLMSAYCADPPPDIDFFFYHSRPPALGNPDRSYRIVRPHWPYVRVPFAMPLALLRDRIDVAHFQYFAPPWCPAPRVLTVHDLSFERHPEFFDRAMALRMRALMPLQARRAACIIAVSEATRHDIIELYGIAPERVVVVHNGGHEGWDAPADPAIEASILARFRLERPFLVCVGNLGRRKNQRRIVRAFGRLIEGSGVDHDLVLVGQATHSAPEIMAAIDGLVHRERVRVIGFVEQAALRAIYRAATASIYVSLYEGFGLPIVESMACGTAVLASSVSCMPEIAGDAALLVDPRDEAAIGAGMLRLIEDADLRRRLCAAGKARAGSYSWAQAAQRTAAVYRRVHRG